MKFPSPYVAVADPATRAANAEVTFSSYPSAAPRSGRLETIGDYIRLCLQHWQILSLILVAAGLVTLFVTRLQPPEYRAETLFEVRSLNPDFLNLRQETPVYSTAYSNPTELLIDMETQMEVLRSGAVRQKTIEGLIARGPEENWRPQTPDWSLPGLKPAIFTSSDVLRQVASTVYVRRSGETKLVRVEVDAPNPVLAADFANALIREYIQVNIRSREQMDRDAENLTVNELAVMRSRIAGEEASLQKYAVANHLIYGSDQRTISDEELTELQSDLLQARSDLAAKDAERQVALSRKSSALPAVISDVNLRALQSQLIELRRKEAELATVYQPEHERIERIRAAAAKLESEIQEETGKVIASIDTAYQQARQKEKTLSAEYAAAVRDNEKKSAADLRYGLLTDDLKVDLSAYERALSRAKYLNLASVIKATDLRVVEPAVPPSRRHTPAPLRNMVMGLFTGLIIGVAWVAGREHFSRNVRVPGDLAASFGIDELGAISTALRRGGVLNQLRGAGGLRLTAGSSSPADEPATDDFRGLAASLLWSSSRDRARVIVITSTAHGDGKTTVAANLGSALARAGRVVLLIDGNVRHPALHTQFGLNNRRGLGDILHEQADDADVLSTIQPTPVAGLSLLSSGSDRDSLADLLFQPRLKHLLDRLRRRYDLILVDSPPLSSCADARSLANASDGVIVIARSRRTAREAVRRVCERLRLDGARLLGVVLNDCRADRASYKYYA